MNRVERVCRRWQQRENAMRVAAAMDGMRERIGGGRESVLENIRPTVQTKNFTV